MNARILVGTIQLLFHPFIFIIIGANNNWFKGNVGQLIVTLIVLFLPSIILIISGKKHKIEKPTRSIYDYEHRTQSYTPTYNTRRATYPARTTTTYTSYGSGRGRQSGLGTQNAGIYKITNIHTGRVYIGQSVDCYSRIQQHINNSRHLRGVRSGKMSIDEAIRNYGETAFRYEIIESIPYANKPTLDQRERHWISVYNSYNRGYNKTRGNK